MIYFLNTENRTVYKGKDPNDRGKKEHLQKTTKTVLVGYSTMILIGIRQITYLNHLLDL